MKRLPLYLLGGLSIATTDHSRAADFGVNTKFSQGLTGLRMIEKIRDAGVKINRDSLPWASIEPRPSILTWSRANAATYAALKRADISTDIVLTTRNRNYDGGRFPTTPAAISAFARYAAFVARTLRGQAIAYEIGNEWRPTRADGPVTYLNYIDVFIAGANAIHAADPGAKVVADPAIYANATAGPLPGRQTMLGAAARRAFGAADGVVVHQYPYQHARISFARAQDLMTAAMTRRAAWLAQLAGRPVPLYVTEYGWPQMSQRGLTAVEQGAQLAETTRRLAAMPFVRMAIAYELVDSCTNESNVECTFGLYARGARGSVAAKPALVQFRLAAGKKRE